MNLNKSLLTAALAVSLAACGGGGSSSGGGGGTRTTTITDVNQGSSVASTSVQATIVGANSVNLSSLVGGAAGVAVPAYRSALVGQDPLMNRFAAAFTRVAQASKLNAAAVKATDINKTEPCTDGGSASYVGWSTTTELYIEITYNSCREGDTLLNGPIAVAGAGGDYTVHMGSGTGVIGGGDDLVSQTLDPSATPIDTFTIDLAMGMSVSSDDTTDTLKLTFNGEGELTDASGVASFSYANFKATSIIAADGTNGDDSMSGAISLGWNDGVSDQRINLTYDRFALGWDQTDPAFYYNTINGTIRLDFDPDVICNGASADGTFTFATTTPIKYDTTTWTTVAGELTVNRNTTVVYNSDGSVDVTVNGISQHFNTAADLEGLCPIPEMPEIDL